MRRLYFVKDMVSQICGPLFPERSDESAKRTLMDLVNPTKAENNSDLAKFPKDFALHFAGQFDEVSGLLVPEKAPVHICVLAELVKNT